MFDENLPDWAQPMSDAELRAEHDDYEFGARYDRWDGYGDPDPYPSYEEEEELFGCGFEERREAAAAVCKAMFALRAPEEIPF